MSPRQPGHISVEGVWKRFRRGQPHDSLRDVLPALSKRLFRGRTDEVLRTNEFWAVRDLSFEVKPGQAVGIIGANGAGKSTTLKILTRILRPTYGRFEVSGRIGALIEISAGFHADLTGAENVYLQGSIMGMPQALIRKHFDEIVEFSGVSEFIDTPVKRYSSGMSARLGFAIAAHLDPDVLIIDEVLAVGDYKYQDRAFGRIRELVKSGIPVVMVSHQLDRIASLCTEAIVLERGSVVHRGTASDAIAWYLSGNRSIGDVGPQKAGVRLSSLSVIEQASVPSGSDITMDLDGTVEDVGLLSAETVELRVRGAATGQLVFSTNLERCQVQLRQAGPFKLRITLEMNLRPGVYALEPVVTLRASDKEVGVGPVAYIQIQDDPGFSGIVQLKPRMRVVT